MEKNIALMKSNYSPEDAFSNKSSEETEIKFIEKNQDAQIKEISPRRLLTLRKLKELALKNNKNFIYMGEIGAGTGAAAYPPFMLMWFLVEPELLCKWIEIKAKQAFYETRTLLEEGCEIIAIGGDVSSDKGPIISPAHYREFILPVIKKHVDIIHSQKAYAVYTSDGNHWDIKEDFFFNSNIDGYKEVDFAAGMTFEKLIKEGVKEKVCIIGNIDARHLLCNGTPQDVRKEVMRCLSLGRETPGGHILHTSHSVHEDVKIENYYAMINAYREFFGLEQLEIQGVL
jgi:uroporphyrinogen-III decarboxylase